MSADFLVEIGTEELPPKALRKLSSVFEQQMLASLAAKGIDHGAVSSFATPRRLALRIEALEDKARDTEIEAWGPPLKICFDEQGNPTKPALAFVEKNRALGASIETLKSSARSDGKTEKLYLKGVKPGAETRSCIASFVNDALAALPIPKRMRWGSSHTEFVRPVHWVVMLLGKEALTDTPVLGITPSNQSRGHRFHSQGNITIASPGSYEDDLHNAFVVADFNKRQQIIEQGVTALGQSLGGSAMIDNNLLEEVTALNEWPVPLAGKFDPAFLSVPAEALISSMKSHQKYFHVVDQHNALLPNFITVANIASQQPETVIAGNEKVIRPRLADAAFFFKTDKKTTQTQRRERLKPIVFQAQLGSIFDKTERIAQLSKTIAPLVGADSSAAFRASQLCKADLVSEMVLEFDDLQGLMGQYYAQHDGETDIVASAMFEHYLPRFAGDILPSSPEALTLALADRLDTLTGIFGIGQLPTGSKDPFALRRLSLGVIRILIEKSLDIQLLPLLELSASLHNNPDFSDDTGLQVLTYISERFSAMYPDIKSEVIQSVMAKKLNNPLDIHLRIQAVNSFLQLPSAGSLAAANKRVQNILAKNPSSANSTINASYLVEPAETELVTALKACEQIVLPLIESQSYTAALTELAQLQKPVDAFFDTVMVMAEDQNLRNNRLAILSDLQSLFLHIADISLLAGLKND